MGTLTVLDAENLAKLKPKCNPRLEINVREDGVGTKSNVPKPA
jgi:hypothetical protein